MVVLSSVLCAILVIEIAYLPPNAGSGEKVAVGDVISVAVEPLPAPVLSKASLTDILERPLFSPLRRPPVRVLFVTPLPRLSGLIITSHSREAIFVLSDGSQVVLVQGSRLGTYVLKDVSLTSASLLNTADNHELKIELSAPTKISTIADNAGSFMLMPKPPWLHENLGDLANEKFQIRPSPASLTPMTSLLPDSSATLGVAPRGMTN